MTDRPGFVDTQLQRKREAYSHSIPLEATKRSTKKKKIVFWVRELGRGQRAVLGILAQPSSKLTEGSREEEAERVKQEFTWQELQSHTVKKCQRYFQQQSSCGDIWSMREEVIGPSSREAGAPVLSLTSHPFHSKGMSSSNEQRSWEREMEWSRGMHGSWCRTFTYHWDPGKNCTGNSILSLSPPFLPQSLLPSLSPSKGEGVERRGRDLRSWSNVPRVTQPSVAYLSLLLFQTWMSVEPKFSLL